MKLIEETFTDINGRKFRRNTVRSSGDGSFLTLDKLHGSALGREAVCSARATGAAAGSERANQRLEAGGGTGSFASLSTSCSAPAPPPDKEANT
jgi:hypothetical protein